MGAAANGMAAHGGILPFTATFLTFSDYMRPAIRLAALMQIHVIFVFTHESIGLGEDGPTHQPIGHLASLRAIPGLTVIRPGDANETAVAWRVAIENQRPVILALLARTSPTLDRNKFAPAEGLRRGAYVLADAPNGKPDVILMASGSEVGLIVGAQSKLQEEGVQARLVSMPSWELFDAQPKEYRDSVLPPASRHGSPLRRACHRGGTNMSAARTVIGMERFGVSAPFKVLFEKFGFTVDNVTEHALRLVKREVTMVYELRIYHAMRASSRPSRNALRRSR